MQDFFGLGGLPGMGGGRRRGLTGIDTDMNDTSEQIYISPLSLLKMLRHG